MTLMRRVFIVPVVAILAFVAGVVGCALKTVTKTGNPISTTVAGRRYVIDFTPLTLGVYSGTADQDTFSGATIKYTCTSPCVP